jgi:hypothetical protein
LNGHDLIAVLRMIALGITVAWSLSIVIAFRHTIDNVSPLFQPGTNAFRAQGNLHARTGDQTNVDKSQR